MENKDKIRNLLYLKMETEYEIFIDNLLKKKPKEIINSSYEKVIKEDILSMFDPYSKKFDLEEINYLYNEKNPLQMLYQEWMDSNYNESELVEENLLDTLERLLESQNEKNISSNKRERER